MNQWYYAVGGQQHGPVSDDVLRGLVAASKVPADAMAWADGMPGWVEVRTLRPFADALPQGADRPVPTALPAAAGVALAYEMPHREGLTLTPRAVELFRQTKPWVRLFSVLMFIGVGFMILGGIVQIVSALALAGSIRGGRGNNVVAVSVVGAAVMLAFGVLYLVPAIYLGRYASRIGELMRLGRQSDLECALEAQKSFWKFVGILFIVGVGLYLMAIVVMIVGFGVLGR